MSTMTRGETTRLDVRVLAVRKQGTWQGVSGRVRLIVEGHLTSRDVLRGDRLEVAALLVAVRGASNPGAPDFSEIGRRRRQRAVLLAEHFGSVRRFRRGSVWSPLRWLGKWRLMAESALDRHVTKRYSPLAAALLLGSRERLDAGVVQTFFVSGMLHLLAISGLHVGILATIFWLLLRLGWFSRTQLLWTICVVVVSYTMLTGARPPVVRATILILIYCLARGVGRSPQPWNSLAAAGLATLGICPAGLFDPGTQLSFLAVGTLIACWPVLATWRHRHPLAQLVLESRPLWLRALHVAGDRTVGLLRASSVVWCISLPLVASCFHLVAPVGLVLNVLLWLPVAGALFSALFTVLTAPLPLLPDLFGAFCALMLQTIESLASIAARIPGGHFWVAGPPWWWVTLFYAGLIVRLFSCLTVSRRWWLALLCGWMTVAILCGSTSKRVRWAARRPPLRLSFVAVGHGLSVLVELPDGKVVLYDAGRMGSPRAAALPIASVLWARRITHIDALVLSHADADHFNAVPELLDRFSVGIVYVSPKMFRARTPALVALRAAIDAAHVPVGRLHENLKLADAAGVVIEVLHPPSIEALRDTRELGDNENCIVMQLTYGRHQILLTGDIEGRGLDELLAELPITCDVLLAPHHGSRHSRPNDIVDWANPSVVVVGAGAGLSIEPTERAYSSKGASVFWTHRDGMVEVVTDGQRLDVSAWRQSLFW